MIRRGFWVLVGAVGGVLGYRRVTAFGRRLSGTLSPADNGGPGQPAAMGATRNGQGPNSQRPDGQRPDRQGPSRQALSRKARRGLIRGTIRFTRDARRFGRDVREGMDLYMVRRTARQSPTLEVSADSRRPPARPRAEALGVKTINDDRVNDDRVKDDR